MSDPKTKIGTHIVLETDFDTALTRTVAALKDEGFGVLTEIDVKDTLKKKLDVDFRPYRILGACNPPLAHRALTASPDVGMLLPCNVTVSEVEPGKVLVSIIDPLVMLSVVDHPDLAPIAAEAEEKLARVAAALRG